MSYLLSQLWLCLAGATLLGGLVGWFLRGDNRKKLDIIEKRWRERFTELEYANQSLQGQLTRDRSLESKHKKALVRLSRMNKIAELSNQQLKLKNSSIAKMEQQLEQSRNEMTDKDSRLDEMVSKLSNLEVSLDEQATKKSSIEVESKEPPLSSESTEGHNIKNGGKSEQTIKNLQLQLDEKDRSYQKLKKEHSLLVKKTDGYKTNLLDAESKLKVTNELLENQSSRLDELEELKSKLKKAEEKIKKNR